MLRQRSVLAMYYTGFRYSFSLRKGTEGLSDISRKPRALIPEGGQRLVKSLSTPYLRIRG
jgi:hypothetical protein